MSVKTSIKSVKLNKVQIEFFEKFLENIKEPAYVMTRKNEKLFKEYNITIENNPKLWKVLTDCEYYNIANQARKSKGISFTDWISNK